MSNSAYLEKPLRTEHECRTERDYLAVAVGWKKVIWRSAMKNEDKRIDRLVDICTRLHDGDAKKGGALAIKAIWEAGKI